LFVNLMLLLIFFLLFYICYLILKIFEFIILKKYKSKVNNTMSLPKYQLFILNILKHIDIGAPLMFYLLFWIPIIVFCCINLKYASSTSHTLFTASSFFSIFFILVSLVLIGLMAFYLYKLYVNTKRFVSTDIEYYYPNSFHNNMTLHHFPKKPKAVKRTSKHEIIYPRFGPYNLHFLNFINERPNDQFNLEELYKHVVDEQENKKHSK
jgi:hypothetical protein